MPYAILEKKINSLPEEAFVRVLQYVDELCEAYMNVTISKKTNSNEAFGCLSQYANPALWEKEKEAWVDAVAEKYDLH